MEKLFRIFEITEELVESILSKSLEPHWHDFEELIIVTEGSLEHSIDFTVEEVTAPVVSYVSMGKTHKLIPRSNLRGWVINYKNEFIPDSGLHFYSNFFTNTTIQFRSSDSLSNILTLCRLMRTEYIKPTPEHKVIRHLVNALIAMVEAERDENLPCENTSRASQITTFNSFLQILEEHFRRDEGVSFYAGKMNMTERNLNLICKTNFQKSVSEIIETRRLIEAKHLLVNSEKTISEIGFELGYNEKSYFTRVFRNKTGFTPSAFREQTRALFS
ncbi:MAG: AraC family transcriptional regulator [Bacteroidota bacterium]